MKPNSMLGRMLLAAALCHTTIGSAAMLRVAVDEATQNVRVFDGVDASAAFANAATMSVQTGTVTADAASNRAFFIGNSAGAQSLYQLLYTTNAEALPQALATTLRVTHMEIDASGATRLLGAAIDPADDSVKLIALSVPGATVTNLGMPIVDCCVFRIGVSAFRSSDDSLYFVGRRSTDTQDHLFRFTMNPPSLAQAVAIPVDLSVNELVVNAGGQLLGLAYSTAAAATKVFTSDAALNLTLLGSGVSDCCFVMAGSAALNTSLSTLVTLGPGIAGLAFNAPRQWSFNIGSGAISDGMTPLNGAGLFFDTNSILIGDVLFASGFE
jgi:hypothetical protein